MIDGRRDEMPTKDKTKIDERRDEELEEGLEESFPASDPPAATQPGDGGAEEKDKR